MQAEGPIFGLVSHPNPRSRVSYMKRITTTVIIAAALLSASSVAADIGLVERNWVKVDENHAEVSHAGRDYVLDTYIVMFQQPYYIHVRAKDTQAWETDDLLDMVSEYIKPRGCTQALERRSDLDRSNAEGNERILGFQC